MTMNNESRG